VISNVFARPWRVRGSVTDVALGDVHTCAIAGGGVTCWGANIAGQTAVPAGVSNAVALAAGATFTCALDAGGAVTCWGGNMPAVPALGGAARAISAGAGHACALVGEAVRCWGAGAVGQLGVAPAVAFSSQPVEAVAGIAAIAAGSDLTCAATAAPNGNAIDDALLCWGSGLGLLLDADPATTPLIPMKRADQSVVRFDVDAVAVGRTHVCVQRKDVTPQPVSCLGSEVGFGQLGEAIFSGEAIDIAGTSGALDFAAGADHGCAITAVGGVTCWGSNASGQLGDGTQVTPGLGDDIRLLGTPVSVSGR
jgi:alpha-tubulin suppressor-like RCC1 family protein